MLCIPGVSLAALLLVPATSRAANTWDGGGGEGNWSTVLNWDDDTLPDFPAGITFAGAANLITNNDLTGLTVGGITFVQPAEAFMLGGNAITLSGAINQNSTGGSPIISLPVVLSGTQTVNVIEDAALTFGPGANGSGVVSGAGSLTKSGPGSLIMGAANTYTGDTILNGGLLQYTANNTATNLVFGPAAAPPFSDTTSDLYLTDANLVASSLAVRTNSTLPNTITIGSGRTLTINGAVSVGPNTSGLGAAGGGVTTRLDATGAGSFVVAGTGHFSVALPRLNADTGADPFSTADLQGLSSFSVNTGTSTGELRVGGGNARGILNLSNISNTINVASVRVGDSGATSGGSGNNNGGTSTLSLGRGTNDIAANSLIIGAVKSHGILDFQGPDGSVTIAGRAGGTANITVGNASSATATNNTSQFLLAGHSATVQAGTVIIGQLAGSTAGQGAGNVTFGTGTFNIVNLQMSVHSTGSAPNGTTGTLTIGNNPGDAATGVLNVTNQFLLVNRTSTAGTVANSNLTINGGTVNIGADILIIDNSPGASRSTTFTLAGGTLNMMGHAIASADFPINTVTITSPGTAATLANLGGTGINGAGLNVNGGSTLILEGANTYTGGTVIEASRLEVGTGGLTGSLPAGDVTNNGILAFNRAGALTVSNAISGTGRIEQIGSGTVMLSGASAFAGPVEVDAGTLVVTGSLSSDINLDAGTLGGNGAIAGSATVNGTLTPGEPLGRLTVGGSVAFAVGSNFRVEIGGTASGEFDALSAGGQITAAGTLTVTFVNDFTPVPGDVFDILDFASLAGTFTAVELPPLAAGQSWNTGKLYTEGKLVVSRALATYAEWQAAYGVGAFDADDDQDGIANGIAYVLGVRPGTGDANAARPRPGIADNRLQIHFELPEPGPADVTLRIAASENPAIADSWTAIATKAGANAWSGPATVTVGPFEGGKVTVTVSDINFLTSTPKRFLRLAAELH